MSRMRSASSSRTNATGASTRSSRADGRGNKATGTNRAGSKAFEYPCSPCNREKLNVEATNYCQDCRENLCASCVKQHLKFPLMKDHKVLGKADRKSGNEADTGPRPSPLECPLHPGKVVDMYCPDHDEVWCGACIALQHKTCSKPILLEEASKGITKTDEFRQVKENMKRLKKSLVTLNKKQQRVLTSREKQKTLALKRIQEYRKRVEKVLDDMEKSTVDELDRAYNNENTKMKQEMKSQEDIVNGLEAASSLMTGSKTENDTEAGAFVGVKRGKKKIEEGECLLESTKQTISTEPLQFVPDSRVTNWLQTLQVLGSFSFHQKIYAGELLENYLVKEADDIKACDIFGCKFIPDGRLLITDWNNRKVKLLNTEFQIEDSMTLDDCPNDLCVMNPQEIAVSLPMQKTIQFINLEPNMSLKHMFKTDESCRGLAFYDGHIYVACGGFKEEGHAKLVVYSITGDITREIETNNSGQRIFICPIAIEISADGSLLYIVDGRRGIVTMTQHNDVISVIADKECVWPCGICLDRHGNIIVCSGQSHNVIQMSGINKIATVLSGADGLKRPHSLCYNPDNMKLVVAMDKSNSLHVFNLRDSCLQQEGEEAIPKPGQPTELEIADPAKKPGTDSANYNVTNGIVPAPVKPKNDHLGMYRQKTTIDLKIKTAKRDKTEMSAATGYKDEDTDKSKQQTTENIKSETWKTGKANNAIQDSGSKQTTVKNSSNVILDNSSRLSISRGAGKERGELIPQTKGRPISRTSTRERTTTEPRSRTGFGNRVSNKTPKTSNKSDHKTTENKANTKSQVTSKAQDDKASAKGARRNSVSRGDASQADNSTTTEPQVNADTTKPANMASRIERMKSSINNIVNDKADN